jgi:uncharacterized membrane protein HdeD (DUF308 family)
MSANEAKPFTADHSPILRKLHPVWKFVMASGILQVIVGLAVFLPVMDPDSFRVLVALMVLAMAVVSGTVTFLMRNALTQTYGVLMTAVRLVTAGMLLWHPLDTSITFATVMATYLGIDGLLGFAEARKVRLAKPFYRALITVSIASVVLSASIWLFLKGANYVTIATLLALTLWMRGGTAIYGALLARRARRPAETPASQPPVATITQ